jgi:uncharacterized phage-associated protein
MQNVLERYAKAIANIYRRAARRQQANLTEEQLKGIAYYTAAAMTVRTLMLQPIPAWTHMKFEKSRIL